MRTRNIIKDANQFDLIDYLANLMDQDVNIESIEIKIVKKEEVKPEEIKTEVPPVKTETEIKVVRAKSQDNDIEDEIQAFLKKKTITKLPAMWAEGSRELSFEKSTSAGRKAGAI